MSLRPNHCPNCKGADDCPGCTACNLLGPTRARVASLEAQLADAANYSQHDLVLNWLIKLNESIRELRAAVADLSAHTKGGPDA